MDACLANETALACIRSWLPGISATIATIALAFTALQFSLSRKTAQRQLRAYVGLKSSGLEIANDAEGRLVITASVVIENFGNTPAYEFETYCQIVGVFPSDANPYDNAPPVPISGRGSSILFPRKTVNSGAQWVISQSELEAVAQGRMKIFFHGGADYTDVFKKKRFSKYFDRNGPPHDNSHWTTQPHSRGYKAN